MAAAFPAVPDSFFYLIHSSLPLLSTLLLFFISSAVVLRSRRSVTGANKLGPPPPSPPAFPFIGHLHLLKGPLHRAIDAVSAAWGPVVLLHFGSRPVLVVSSPSAAEECFTANDVVFANRPRLLAGRILGYNYTSVLWAPYGPHWRNLSRLNSVHLLSSSRVRASALVRVNAVRALTRSLFSEYGEAPPAGMRRTEMKPRLFELSYSVMVRMTAGEETSAPEEGALFREVIEESLRLSGASNPGDFLPALRWVGWRGPEKKLSELRNTRDQLMDGILERRRRRRSTEEAEHAVDGGGGDNGGRSAMIDIMLSLQDTDPQSYTDEIIKGIILSLITAGTDTTAVTMEWAMALLVNHPHVVEKARAELDAAVGAGRMVRDDDLANLPYLDCIISETLRLRPAGPLLVPHESSEACTVGGYAVPGGTMLLVNAQAIQRDPKLWDRPEEFEPERFLSGGKEQAGKYASMTFGAGRRRCPGEGLATRVIGLTLATLIHCFEFERTSPEKEDMSEGWGLTVPKGKPLEVMYRPRPNMVATLSAL